MKKNRQKPIRILGIVTALLCAALLACPKKDAPATRPAPVAAPASSSWQLPATNLAAPTTPAPGFEGLYFTSDRSDGYFCLTEDAETGIQYAYVPAEMGGSLFAHLRTGEHLQIGPADADFGAGSDGLADTAHFSQAGDAGSNEPEAETPADLPTTFSSGDALPIFEDGIPYTFTILSDVPDADSPESEPPLEDEIGKSESDLSADRILGRETVIFRYSENVPSMYVDTQSGSMDAIDKDRHHQTAEPGAYRIYHTDGTPDSSGLCRIKGRGNSTWSQKKKPYNLNLDQSNALLGMDACKKYALIANFWDSTQTRQYYAFLAAERLGLAFTPQTRFVNVYLNGRYHGLCLLTQRLHVRGGTVQIDDLDKANEKANKTTLHAAQASAADNAAGSGAADGLLKGEASPNTENNEENAGKNADPPQDEAAAPAAEPLPAPVVMETDESGHEAHAYDYTHEPADLTGGYLLEFQNRYEDEDAWFSTDTLHIAFKSPETPSVGEYAYISGYVREAEKALYADDWTNPDTGLGVFDYFDMDSWARMYLVQDFFVQSDDEYYSFFFYKKRQDPLLYCGPVWDFDLCLGNMNCGDYYRTSAQTLWLKDGRKKWLHRLQQHPDFAALVARLYLEDLDPILRSLMKNQYDQTVDLLETDTNLHYLRWHKNLDYRERTGLVRTLLTARMDFMRDYYENPARYHRLLFHFAWDDFSYYVKDGEPMGFLPTYDYGEKQSSPQREANGLITGWQDTETGALLTSDEPIYADRDFNPVYIP